MFKKYNSSFDFLKTLGIETSEEDQIYIKTLAQIGAQIMAYRKKHNLTQTALAKKIGVSQVMISKIERGEKNVSIKVLAKIVSKLGGKINIDLGIVEFEDRMSNIGIDIIEFKGFKGKMGDPNVGLAA